MAKPVRLGVLGPNAIRPVLAAVCDRSRLTFNVRFGVVWTWHRFDIGKGVILAKI
jgi:hypothetical protein